MSKMDNLRAMREARYDRAVARGVQAAATRPALPHAPAALVTAEAEPLEAEPDEEVCGHRNMGGRTCTRERGHSAKSHRYS